MVGDGGSGLGHRFDKVNLFVFGRPAFIRVSSLTAGVDIGFAVARGNADGLVFEVGAKAAHNVAFAVGEIKDRVVVVEVFANDIVFEVFAIFDKDFRLTFRIHDVYALPHFGEAVCFGDFVMVFGVSAFTWVGGIAFDDSAV